jgi:hypothetical protein
VIARVASVGSLVACLSVCLMGASSAARVAAQDAAPIAPRPRGVDERVEQAIARGLDHLVRVQGRDGAWRGSGTYGSYPTAMTALAGMALLGSGSTPTRGPRWQPVREAVEFLLRCAQQDGLISAGPEEGRSMYGHGFATMFLAEVYGMEEDARRQKRIHEVLTGAVAVIVRAQSRAGGWYYTPDSGSDEGSVTITQLQALRACRNAGIAVPGKTVAAAVDYIAKSANADGGIRYSIHSGGASRPPITAAAVATLYNAGRYDDPMAERALQFAMRTLPIDGANEGHHYYGHLYLAQSLWQRGGPDFDDYYAKFSRWLLTQQQSDGAWSGDGVGTNYGTSIALTILLLPYDAVSVYQR